MIYDSIENIGNYKGLGENMDKAIDFLASYREAEWQPGKFEIDGDRVYFMAQSPALVAKSDARFEAHMKYADIQYALEDGEEIGYLPAACANFTEVREGQDVKLTDKNGGGVSLPMSKGMFAIFFPCDAHSPCRATGEKKASRKLVVKVLL